MATTTNAGTDDGCRCTPHHPAARFKPFEWVPGEQLDLSQRSQAAFLNSARDVVQGAHTLAQLLEWDEDRRDAAASGDGPAQVFDAGQRSALQRLLAASLDLLHAQIEAQCELLTG